MFIRPEWKSPKDGYTRSALPCKPSIHLLPFFLFRTTVRVGENPANSMDCHAACGGSQ
jgi:hypothetical protein